MLKSVAIEIVVQNIIQVYHASMFQITGLRYLFQIKTSYFIFICKYLMHYIIFYIKTKFQKPQKISD